jgi:hypothetical protein
MTIDNTSSLRYNIGFLAQRSHNRVISSGDASNIARQNKRWRGITIASAGCSALKPRRIWGALSGGHRKQALGLADPPPKESWYLKQIQKNKGKVTLPITVAAPARTLGSWVRIPLEAWMSVLCTFILCWQRPFHGLIPRPRSPTDCI